ncbi:MAG: outer membrane lipoprotein chaperone LolA [Sulfuriflexus sp.]|nr:outer membrane lipoprotein chaperone LolA [Sulfuriflexus sp.]
MLKAVVILFVLTISSLAQAGTGMDRLKAFFTDVTSVRADFTQQVVGVKNKVLQETSGQMLLLRPGRFRWDYKKPYEQEIVSNGKKVWLYDVDLEQVTVKTLDGVLGSTPALLLSSDTPIEKNFIIKELGEERDLQWVELTPIAKESGFDKLVLGFDDASLINMELHDAFGQLTRLHFSKIEHNPVIDPARFDFIPPKDVDVIGE